MDKILSQLAAGAAVVTATRQQADHLHWQYGRYQQARGRQAWPAPAVQMLSAWIDQGWEHSLLHGGIGATHALLSRTQARRVWCQLLEAEVDASPALLHLVDQAWRLLHDWRIPPGAIARQADTLEAERFSGWANRFERLCRDNHWLDSVAAMDALGQELAGRPPWRPARLLFVGFEHWHPALDTLAKRLCDGGCDARPIRPSTNNSKRCRVDFGDERDELNTASRWAAGAGQAEPGASFALVVPEPEALAPALRRTTLDRLQPEWRQLSEQQRPIGGGLPRQLADLGLVHAALLCLRVCAERMEYQALGQLLRTPYLKGSEADRAGRARLDVWLRERGERNWDLAVVCDKAAELELGLAEPLRKASRAARTGLRSPAAWADWVTRHLANLGWPGKDRLDADEMAAVRAWEGLLEKFAGCGVVTGCLSFSAARQMLGDLAREEPAPLVRQGGGLQLLGVAEALGQQFDGLWIAGLHGEAWPTPMQPNALVPLALQRKARVPEASPDSHAQHATALMQQLLRAADTVIVSASRRRGDERLTPTPWLAGVRPANGSELVARHAPSLTEAILARKEIEVVADPAPKFAGGQSLQGGVRLLQLQALCPARAFFELRLHAKELPVPSFGIDAAMRGQWVHAVLERLYKALRERDLQPAAPEAWDLAGEIIECSPLPGLPPTPLNRVLKALEVRRLKKLVRQLFDFECARPPFVLAKAEESLQVPLGGLRLNLRVDRIDQLDAGARLVIDYKTGAFKSTRDWFKERPPEPQLPLYAVGTGARSVTYIRLGEDGVSARGIAADDIAIPGIDVLGRTKQTVHEDWDKLVADWRVRLAGLVAEFIDGDCAIDLDAPDLAGGQYAPLTRVCDHQVSE